MQLHRVCASLLLAWATSIGAAPDVPTAGPHDPRVRLVDYKPEAVTLINVQRGVVTRIVLGRDEKILSAGTGLFAECQKPEAEWCIRAEAGSNNVWIKPRDGAQHNNLELSTDRGDYSFELRVLDAQPAAGARAARARPEQAPMYRVIFRYPERRDNEAPAVAAAAAQLALALATPAPPAKSDDAVVVRTRLAEASPSPRNWSYSMQVMPGGDELVPSVAFDDGRFTYFGFGANRGVPTVYIVDGAGEEGMAPVHMDGDLLVVQQTARRFVLRLGAAVVGVWNDAYDHEGRAPQNGTTVDGVARHLRTQKGGER